MVTLKTLRDIKTFQKKYRLVVDGIVGPQTKKALAEVNKEPSAYARKEPEKTAMALWNGAKPPANTQKVPAKNFTPNVVVPNTARPIKEIIYHCTATPEGKWFDRNDVNAWHKQRGWSMIGYHFLILLDGTIQVGRPIGMVGAHTNNHNVGSIGIAYVGGLTKDMSKAKDTRTAAQIAASLYLVKKLRNQFKIKARVKGHNEYDNNKACPSFSVYDDILATAA